MVDYIGRYQISETLGRGGMGTVYKAIDPNLERIVAVKCLNDDLSEDELVIARFLREARNVAALSHPNCVRLYLADEQDGKPYLVMEYVDGETLADRLKNNGALALDEANRIVSDCARALAAADEKNIVHRDVKPGNIMIDRTGRTLLTDFGIAQIQYEMAAEGASTITGTPGYMPPELIRDGKSDRRGDIFALGAVYYEMLTGRRLIEGRDLPSCSATFARSGFPNVSVIADRFGSAAEARLRKMLDPDPDRRYADYQALLGDFAPDEAAASARARETAPTSVMQRGAAPAEQPATISVQAVESGPPVTHTLPLEGAARWRRAGVIAAVAVGIAVMSIAIALTTGGGPVAEPDFDQPPDRTLAGETGGFGDADADHAGSRGAVAVVPETAVEDTGALSAGGSSGASASPPTQDQPQVSATALLRELRAERDPGNEAPVAAANDPADTRLAMVDGAATAVASPAAASPRTNTAAPAPDKRTSTAAAEPRGIAVVPVGDVTIASTMASLIEQRLQSAGLPVVEHRFIPGVDQYLLPDGLDLAGLVGPAKDAGVRYVVMARAIPAGSRELNFYGNYDVAYSVQADSVAYDLLRGTQVGTWRSRQVEYTSLNADQKARSSATPWLDPIARQLGRLNR